jgi:hypothetical protein
MGLASCESPLKLLGFSTTPKKSTLVNATPTVLGNALVPRQEMTGADRTWAQKYQVDHILRYSRSSRETGIKKGEYIRVMSTDPKSNLLTVMRADCTH